MSRSPILRFSRRYICFECTLRSSLQSRQKLSISICSSKPRYASTASPSFPKSSSTPGFYPPANQTDNQFFAHLTNRALVRLQGLDVVSFLNGLLPSRLQPLPKDASNPIFTAFLTAKGRILYDVFIFPPTASDPEGPWYLDVDSSSAPSMLSHLKKHKLRSKFKLEKVPQEEFGVFYVWPGQKVSDASTAQLGGQDPRPFMGTRFLSSPTAPSPVLTALRDTGKALTLEDYTIHRMITGHAEGPAEMINGSALPQESNIDFSHGIDFHKGCYLGQELTIRTHHTGVVRKRILPCQISSQPVPPDQELPMFDASVSVVQPPHESSILKVRSTGRAGRSTGKWLGGAGNVGLALCRLEMMTDIQLTAEGTNYNSDDQFRIVWEDDEPDTDGKTNVNEVMIKPFVPSWLRQNIEAGIQARSDRSRRKRQEEEDEDDEI